MGCWGRNSPAGQHVAGWVCGPLGRGVCGAGHQWAPFPALLLVSVRQPRLQEVLALHGWGRTSLTPHWLQPGGGHLVDRPQRRGTESSGGRPRTGWPKAPGWRPQPGSTARSPGHHCPLGRIPWVTSSGARKWQDTGWAAHNPLSQHLVAMGQGEGVHSPSPRVCQARLCPLGLMSTLHSPAPLFGVTSFKKSPQGGVRAGAVGTPGP